MHHDGIHAVGHGEGLEVRLYGHGERQLVNEVHRRAGDNGAAAKVLEAEDWKRKKRVHMLRRRQEATAIFSRCH